VTPRRAIALAGAGLSVIGIVLARKFVLVSFVAASAGGVLLGITAAFTAVRQRRELFAAPGVAFILWLGPVLGVQLIWFLRVFEPPPD
jgi:hypothetical protein